MDIYIFVFSFIFRTEKQFIKIPFDMETAKELGMVLDRYKELYFNEVLVGIVLLYVLYPFLKISRISIICL